MKVYVTAPNENWILDRIKDGWRKNKPDLVVNSVHGCDIIWFLDSYSWKNVPFQVLKSKKVVASIHHVVPSKFNLKDFKMRDTIVDHYHVPCEQTRDFIKQHTVKPIHKLGYWCEADLWVPYDHDQAKKEFGLENKFVVGSFQRDTEGSDLTSPKLEKGPDLLCDYLERIKTDKLHVLLGGWRRQYVISRLKKAKIPFTYHKMAPLDQLRRMYAACDLYVVSSRYEGGPQALMEASFMKVPIISTDVGMAKDVLNDNCVIDIESGLYMPTKKDVEACFKKVQKYNIIEHVDRYEKLFNKIIEE